MELGRGDSLVSETGLSNIKTDHPGGRCKLKGEDGKEPAKDSCCQWPEVKQKLLICNEW